MKTTIILSLGFLISLSALIFRFDSKNIRKSFLITHIVFLGLTIFAIILAAYDFGYRGAFTERIIASIWFGTGIALFGLNKSEKAKRILKIYSGIYFWTIPILIIAWFIPRLHFAAAVFGLGIIIDGEFNRYPIDNTYQIQTSVQGVLAYAPTISIVESKCLLFEKVKDNFIERKEKYENIKTIRISDDSVRIIINSSSIYLGIIDTTLYLPKK